MLLYVIVCYCMLLYVIVPGFYIIVTMIYLPFMLNNITISRYT